MKERRKQRRLTQKDAAALIGHTQKWLSDFESGKVDPPGSMLIEIMGLLDVPLQYDLPTDETKNFDDEHEIDFDMNLDR